MAFATLALFPRLPLEIRQQIYLFATLPRIVHVKEWPPPTPDTYRDFKESLSRTLPSDLPIHPSLVHLAPYWSPYLSQYWSDYSGLDGVALRQTTLTQYDFTIPSSKQTKASDHPWKPCQACPRICPLWLSERPGLAWHLCRRSSLYSNAPIPPLLHTCRESRTFLIKGGYSLAFSTRTSEPRTWFHFERDVLYVGYLDHAYYKLPLWRAMMLVLGPPYNIAQFMPLDLQRVKRLALPFDFEPLGQVSFPTPQHCAEFDITHRALSLFPQVEELLSVRGLLYNPFAKLEIRQGRRIEYPTWRLERTRIRARQFWEWIDCSEVDGDADWLKRFSRCTNLNLCDWPDSDSLEDKPLPFSDSISQGLRNCLAAILACLEDRAARDRKIPIIRAVYAGKPEMLEQLSHEGEGYWHYPARGRYHPRDARGGFMF
ncbi:hypothetical protein NM208_g9004 [Fusarium decemcellulare]|uniref:Uncharacterized protein n=1 Tax=Fusarium decemcellulare TaxID=57161 RepID=A0ACC1S3H1_9HYPO|nr:hypothetical protein NM208_g9004 [Fusarium decemcellulare]